MPEFCFADDALGVFLVFALQGLVRFADGVALVEHFNALLETDGDEQADDDGDDVDEEVAPGACGVVRWVDVKHGVSWWESFEREGR